MVGGRNIMCGMELCTQGNGVMAAHRYVRILSLFPLRVSCLEAAVHSCLSDCVVVQSWLITLIVC